MMAPPAVLSRGCTCNLRQVQPALPSNLLTTWTEALLFDLMQPDFQKNWCLRRNIGYLQLWNTCAWHLQLAAISGDPFVNGCSS